MTKIRYVLLTILFALIAVALLWRSNASMRALFSSEMPPQVGENGVELREIAGCSEALAWNTPSRVFSSDKVGLVLKVVVLANETCGDIRPVFPSAVIDGHQIELKWAWWHRPNTPLAACKCTRHIEFTIPNVEATNPVVMIAKSNL